MKKNKITVDEIIKGLDNLSYYHDEKGVHEFLRGAIGLIKSQKSEIERLKNEKEEIRLFNLAIQNGEIDMSIESEMAKSFYYSIIQVFEQNGAKNFFTTTVDIEGRKGRYAFTIEKVGGQTVAEKLAEQRAEIERLTEELKERHINNFKYAQNLKEANAELQKQVDELKEERQTLVEKYNKSDETVDYWCENYKQAVKDTGKQILDEVSKHYGGAWLVELYKRYGVEVE